METHLSIFERDIQPKPRRPFRWAPIIVLSAAFLVFAGALGAIAYLVWPENPEGRRAARKAVAKLPFDPATLTVADPAQLRTVTPEQAEALNAAIPVSKLPNPAATGFVAPTRDLLSFGRSLECMTAAIYYEAATEPLEGQRAVAQVILNRMRHPAFPHTVCGVVYQGSERRTGCQFSFTCDGSLARKPMPALWAKARMVASAALGGSVYAPVGLSTYYHADYVSPYWAGTLTKLAIVGRHIFYRLPGAAGGPAAFSARYADGEPDINAAALAKALEAAQPGTALPGTETSAPMTARPVLANSGGLIGGNLTDPVATSQPPPSNVPAASRWVVSRNAPPPSPQPAPGPTPTPTPSAKK